VIASDASGVTETVRLYRIPDRGAVDDLRRMRPLAPLAADPSNPVEVQDPIAPDRCNAYHAVGVTASGKRGWTIRGAVSVTAAGTLTATASDGNSGHPSSAS